MTKAKPKAPVSEGKIFLYYRCTTEEGECEQCGNRDDCGDPDCCPPRDGPCEFCAAPPGHKEARKDGCICPREENLFGKEPPVTKSSEGRTVLGWWMNEKCSVHGEHACRDAEY